jgi:hypothetical protein
MDVPSNNAQITCKECAERRSACRQFNEERLERLLERIAALREYMEASIMSVEASRSALAAVNEKRLDHLNEARKMIEDTLTLQFSRKEHDMYKEAVDVSMQAIRDERDAYRDRIQTELSDLRESRAELKGKASQSQMTTTFLIAVAALMTALVSAALEALRGRIP